MKEKPKKPRETEDSHPSIAEQSDLWTTSDVLERWTSLYKGPKLIQRLMQGDTLDKAQQDAADLCIEKYRNRLKDLKQI